MDQYEHDLDSRDWRNLWGAAGLAFVYVTFISACVIGVRLLWKLWLWWRGVQ